MSAGHADASADERRGTALDRRGRLLAAAVLVGGWLLYRGLGGSRFSASTV